MKLSVTTRWVDLKVDDDQIELNLHATAADPRVHTYSSCSLRDLPLTRTDCDNLIRFFTQLREAL